MTIDDLKKIKPIPGFDCVEMKHAIQARIYEDTKDLSCAEKTTYHKRRIAAFRAGVSLENLPEPQVPLLREEPPRDEKQE
jgi:hypothetical protein